MKTLWIRADASPELGFGHLTRCLALAHQLPFTIRWATLFPAPQAGVEVVPITSEADFFEQIDAGDLVLLDQYDYNPYMQASIRERGAVLLAISDHTAEPVHADLIINPTFGIQASEYHALPHTLFAVGLEGAILRPPFIAAAQAAHSRVPNKELMICFGGSDPKNLTAKVLQQLDIKLFEAIHIVLGPGYAHELDHTLINTNSIFIHRNLEADDMAALMQRCYWGIFPTSGILLEALSCNMRVIGGYYVNNQQAVYKHHLKAGNFIDAKTFAPHEIKQALNELQNFNGPKQRPDGTSMSRIQRMIQFLSGTEQYTVRTANSADLETTFKWANDSRTRKFAFNQDPIPYTDHEHWFTAKINSASCIYYILEYESQAMGSIRFDLKDGIATISYLVAPELHGQGLGTRVMQVGLKSLMTHNLYREIKCIQGYVFQENIASQKTFERFGFKRSQAENLYLFTKEISHDSNTSI